MTWEQREEARCVIFVPFFNLYIGEQQHGERPEALG